MTERTPTETPTETPKSLRALELFGELQGRAQTYTDALTAKSAASLALREADTRVWEAHRAYLEARAKLDEELVGDSEDEPSYVRSSYR